MWKNNLIKLYFGIIIILMIIVSFIFIKIILTQSETILIKESKIAGKNRILFTRGVIQKEESIIELFSKNENENENQKELITDGVYLEAKGAEKEIDETTQQDTIKIIQTNQLNDILDKTEDIIEDVQICQEIAQSNTENDETVETTYEGFETIGKIEIPKIELNIPILNNVTVKGMEKAPCLLYSTGELNKNGNSLIVGHNYQNNTLFSNNKKLEVGDEIYITSLDGVNLKYIIYDKFITTPEEVNYLKREIVDKPEITLSCCNDDDYTRIVILAKTQE